MAITQNGTKSLIKSLFGYNYAGTALSKNAVVQGSCSVSGTTVTLASAASWDAGSQLVINVGGTVYVAQTTAAGSSATSVAVDTWYTQGTTTTTASLSASGTAVVAIVAQPLPGYYLGLSSTSQTNYGQVTETGFSELTTNGLGRKAATVAVTALSTPTGASNTTSTITLSGTWTFTGNSSTTVNTLGVFNAPYLSGRTAPDTLEFCTQVASAPTVSTQNDQLVVTETISQS